MTDAETPARQDDALAAAYALDNAESALNAYYDGRRPGGATAPSSSDWSRRNRSPRSGNAKSRRSTS